MTRFLLTMRLRTRILMLVMVLAIAGIWGVVARVTSILQTDIEALISEEMSSTVGDIAADLERDIQLQLDSLQRVAADIKPAMLRDPENLQRYLSRREAMAALFPEGMIVADREGRIVVGSQLADGLASIADRPYFRRLMAEGTGVVGSPVESGQLQPAHLAVPVRDEAGVARGALVGLVRLDGPFMLGQFATAKIGHGGYFVVARREDRMIISAPQPGRIGTRLPPRGVIPDLDRRLDDGFEGAQITVTALGQQVMAVSRQIANTDWVLLAAAPTKEIFAPIGRLEREIYGSALLATVLVLAILGWVLKREFARLERAAEAIRRMTGGEMPLRSLPITRDDEIGALKRSFNRLAAERRSLEEELRSEVDGHRQARDEIGRAHV